MPSDGYDSACDIFPVPSRAFAASMPELPRKSGENDKQKEDAH